MSQIAQTRFVVTWISTAKVEALCAERGAKPDDGTGLWDWVEPDECEAVWGKFSTFREALAAARKIAKDDVLFMPRIYEQHSTISERGKVEWNDTAYWEAGRDCNRHSDPDYIYDMAA